MLLCFASPSDRRNKPIASCIPCHRWAFIVDSLRQPPRHQTQVGHSDMPATAGTSQGRQDQGGPCDRWALCSYDLFEQKGRAYQGQPRTNGEPRRKASAPMPSAPLAMISEAHSRPNGSSQNTRTTNCNFGWLLSGVCASNPATLRDIPTLHKRSSGTYHRQLLRVRYLTSRVN